MNRCHSLLPQPTNGGLIKNTGHRFATREWIAQPKWDGYRLLVDPAQVRTRTGKRLAPKQLPPDLEQQLRGISHAAKRALDVELLGTRDDLGPAAVVHDLIDHRLNYAARRAILRSLPGLPKPRSWRRPADGTVILTPDTQNLGRAWELALSHGHEGIVLKHRGSYPLPGETLAWVKYRIAEQL